MKRTFKFNMHATLGVFTLGSVSCPLVATWKRSAQSTSSTPIELVKGKADFKQTLTLSLNMYFDQSKQLFEDKKTMFTFKMSTPKGQKQAGVASVQVASILNNKIDKLDKLYTLEKCPIKDATVFISIVPQLIEQVRSHQVIPSVLQPNNPSVLSSASSSVFGSVIQPPSSQRSIPAQSFKRKSQQVLQNQVLQKQNIISKLKSDLSVLLTQKQQMRSQLQTLRRSMPSDQVALRTQLAKSKDIQAKLEGELTNLKADNQEHQNQLQKMRKRMDEICQMLNLHLNSLQ